MCILWVQYNTILIRYDMLWLVADTIWYITIRCGKIFNHNWTALYHTDKSYLLHQFLNQLPILQPPSTEQEEAMGVVSRIMEDNGEYTRSHPSNHFSNGLFWVLLSSSSSSFPQLYLFPWLRPHMFGASTLESEWLLALYFSVIGCLYAARV
jgi:hypothetical protein